jgi:predicted nucleic acid-binding Zn ribbon protein
MPIYEYRCAECGFEEEYLQKKPSFQKKLTAAGFQLKGSGWYATDFRGGSKPGAKADAKPEGKPEAKTEAKSESKTASKKPDSPASGGTTTS